MFAAALSSIETKQFTPTNATVMCLLLHRAARSLPLRNARTFLLKGAACRNTEMHVINQTECSPELDEVGALETQAMNDFTIIISFSSSGWGRLLHAFQLLQTSGIAALPPNQATWTSFEAAFLKKGVKGISRAVTHAQT